MENRDDLTPNSNSLLFETLRNHLGTDDETINDLFKYQLESYKKDKRIAKLSTDQMFRLLLSDKAIDYRKWRFISPLAWDAIMRCIYNPSAQNAFDALLQTPRAYFFVGQVLGDPALAKVLTTKLNKWYIKTLLYNEWVGDRALNMIGDYACAEVKKTALTITLQK